VKFAHASGRSSTLESPSLHSARTLVPLAHDLALLWQILSGTGFPNQFFNDSPRSVVDAHTSQKISLSLGSFRNNLNTA
jgi:hypothetical protein